MATVNMTPTTFSLRFFFVTVALAGCAVYALTHASDAMAAVVRSVLFVMMLGFSIAAIAGCADVQRFALGTLAGIWTTLMFSYVVASNEFQTELFLPSRLLYATWELIRVSDDSAIHFTGQTVTTYQPEWRSFADVGSAIMSIAIGLMTGLITRLIARKHKH